MTIQYVIHTYSSYAKQASGTPFDFHITHLFRIKVKLALYSNDLQHRLSPSPFWDLIGISFGWPRIHPPKKAQWCILNSFPSEFMFGDHQPPPPSELELSESQLSIQCQCHFIPKRGKDFALAPRQASTTEIRVWVKQLWTLQTASHQHTRRVYWCLSFSIFSILFLPTSIRLGNIWANLSIWMVQTYCTRPYKYASLRCSSKNRKANCVVVEIKCLTASEDTHLPWLPFLLKKCVPKPSKQETSSRGPGHPKVLHGEKSWIKLARLHRWWFQRGWKNMLFKRVSCPSIFRLNTPRNLNTNPTNCIVISNDFSTWIPKAPPFCCRSNTP